MKAFLCRFLSLALVLPEITACSGKPPPTLTLPSERQRSQFGTVGIVSMTSPPGTTIGAPVVEHGGGSALGSLYGVEAVLSSFQGCSDKACAAAILILLPVVAAIGAVKGTKAGTLPPETAKRAEQQIKKVLKDAGPHNSLVREVLLAARREGLATVREVIKTDQESAGNKHAFEEIRRQGIDTLLEVDIAAFGLVGRWGEGGADPLLDLYMEARFRLVNVKTTTKIHFSSKISEMRPPRRFSEWSDNGAAMLREETGKIFADAARTIVEEVFLIVR